ncbi:hypothetical protein TSAR_016994, partial [Trichomalopsis sarcophagae]
HTNNVQPIVTKQLDCKRCRTPKIGASALTSVSALLARERLLHGVRFDPLWRMPIGLSSSSKFHNCVNRHQGFINP